MIKDSIWVSVAAFKIYSLLENRLFRYLAQERREDLHQHFKGFGVQADPRCKKIHPLI